MAAFRERINNNAPTRRWRTLLVWEWRAISLVSDRERRQNGWKTTRVEILVAVAVGLHRSPLKSTRKPSSEFGVPQSSVRDHRKTYFEVRPYQWILSDTDSGRALSDAFPRLFPVTYVPSAQCEWWKCGVDFWSKGNPGFMQSLERNLPHGWSYERVWRQIGASWKQRYVAHTHTHLSLILRATFWSTICQTAGLAVVYRHLWHH